MKSTGTDMKTKEEEFKDELEELRKEANETAQFLYAWLAINKILADDDDNDALRLVNKTPLFWRTVLGGLQQSFFIAMGRIFDRDTRSHTIDRLLKIANKNREIFSAQALEARKRAGSSNADEWIGKYMENIHVPTDDDFIRLSKHVSNYHKIYEKSYEKIRNKIFAHNDRLGDIKRNELWSQTNIDEVIKLSAFPLCLHSAIQGLFDNGHKPVLKPIRRSVDRMIREGISHGGRPHVNERMVSATVKFFEMFVKASS